MDTAGMEPASKAVGSVKVSDEQRDFYLREGYLVIDQISTPDELQRLREIYDRLFSERAGRAATFDQAISSVYRP